MVTQAATVSKSSEPKKGSGFLKTMIIVIVALLLSTKVFKSCESDSPTPSLSPTIFNKTFNMKKGVSKYVDLGAKLNGRSVDFDSPDNNVHLIVTSLSGKTARPFSGQSQGVILKGSDRGFWILVENMNTEIEITLKK